MIRRDRVRGSGFGTVDNKASVYGCLGDRNTERVSASSTSLPTYITATRSHRYLTTLSWCEMNKHVRLSCYCKQTDSGSGSAQIRAGLIQPIGHNQSGIEGQSTSNANALAFPAAGGRGYRHMYSGRIPTRANISATRSSNSEPVKLRLTRRHSPTISAL